MSMQAVAVVLGLIGLSLIVGGFGGGLRGQPGRRARRLVSGAVLGAAGLLVAVVGAGLHTYARLSYEWPVAQVKIAAVDPGARQFRVSIQSLDGSYRETACDLQGDEWLLSARVQTWKPWTNLIGMNATYRLEQVANKYTSAADANAHLITACDIEAPHSLLGGFVPASWQAGLLSFMQAQERRFGSANFMPLADGAIYIVFMTQNGLNAEPANAAARAANEMRP